MPVSTRRVKGSGPKPAAFAFVGEGPGADEDRSGRGFTGKSGRVLWAMVRDYVGITRDDVYVTNLSEYRLTDDRGKDRAPTEEEAAEFTPRLLAEIEEVQPDLVVTLGRWSSWALLGVNLDMAVLNGTVYACGPMNVIPVQHPAAGLHDPQRLSGTSFGLQQVGAWLRGEDVIAPKDAIAKPSYAAYPHNTLPITLRGGVAIDTEGPVAAPWCFQFSDGDGVARLVKAGDKVLIRQFIAALKKTRPVVFLHHALHDLAALKVMGVDIIAMGLRVRDTMIELFLRQHDPQGLKAAARRLCGMEMQEYEDVVGPVVERFAAAYLRKATEEPPAEWAFGEGRKHSVMKRLDGMLYPRPTRGEAKTLTQKWNDESFAAVRAVVEKSFGPMPTPSLEDMDEPAFTNYACRDADATYRLAGVLSQSVDDLHLERVHKIDHDALPLIARMQEVGLLVDTHRLEELEQFVADEKAAVTEVIRVLVGDPTFNPASGDQVAAYCIRMKLPMSRLTKGGKRLQVDEDQLLLVQHLDIAIPQIIYFRELDKLDGTYLRPMWGFLVGDGRYRVLHPSFRTTAAITGRLSCGGDSPNLMAFPARSELGRRVRAIFVAREGHVLGSCDLSQIELRVGAGLSQDENMIQSYLDDADIHTRTAAGVFGVSEEEVNANPLTMRYPAKTMNFLIFFGGREHRLYSEFLQAGVTGYTIESTAEVIEKWFELYPGVERWIYETYRFGREHGWVETEAGRRRYVPALRFTQDEYPFSKLREEAQRQACNFPIQGTAQEIIKRAMPRVDKLLADCRWQDAYAEPLLQIHDELIVEVDEQHAEVVGAGMVEAMTADGPWRGVPLKASWKVAKDWAALK